MYNDFSGSPKVLRQVVRGMLEEGHEVVLVTSRGGVLDKITDNRVQITHFVRDFYSARHNEQALSALANRKNIQIKDNRCPSVFVDWGAFVCGCATPLGSGG